jgi:hypothetical protein
MPAAAVIPTGSTTTQNRAKYLEKFSAYCSRITRGEEKIRGRKLTLWLPGLIREGGRRVEEGEGRRDLPIDRHWKRVPDQKRFRG